MSQLLLFIPECKIPAFWSLLLLTCALILCCWNTFSRRSQLNLDRQELERQRQEAERQSIEHQKLERQRIERQEVERQELANQRQDLEYQRQDLEHQRQELERRRQELEHQSQKLERQKFELQELERQKFELQELERQKFELLNLERQELERQQIELQNLERRKLERQKLEQLKFQPDYQPRFEFYLASVELRWATASAEKIELNRIAFDFNKHLRTAISALLNSSLGVIVVVTSMPSERAYVRSERINTLLSQLATILNVALPVYSLDLGAKKQERCGDGPDILIIAILEGPQPLKTDDIKPALIEYMGQDFCPVKPSDYPQARFERKK